MAMEEKIAILLEPANLLADKEYLSLMTVPKKQGIPSYKQDRITLKNIEQLLTSGWPQSSIVLLRKLSIEENQRLTASIYNQQRKNGADFTTNRIFRNALDAHKHAQLKLLQDVALSQALFHRIVNPKTGNLMVAACRFAKQTPVLSFEADSNQKGFQINTFVAIGERRHPLAAFIRYEYLLNENSNWYLLSLKDSRTLSWLETAVSAYAMQPELFVEKILAPLEADYTVDRKNYFSVKQIHTKPTSSVYLSELNDAFLVLIPRWNYDGFIIDGEWKETEQRQQRGEKFLIYRDSEMEEAFRAFVHQLHPKFAEQASRGFYFLPFAEARKKQWFIKSYRSMLEHNVDVAGLDMLQHFRYCPHEATTQLETLSQTASQIELQIKVFFAKEEVPLVNIQKMLLSGQRNILLKDDSIAVFSEEWIQTYALLLKHGLISKNKVTISPWILLGNAEQASEKRAHLYNNTIPSDWRSDWQRWQSGEQLYAIPEGINATLRPYQHKGFEWMVLLSQIDAGICLADDMGLGKTLQTICFLAWLQQNSPEAKSIIICPSSLVYNWEQELSSFAPVLKPYVYTTQQRNFDEFLAGDYQILVTSYHLLRQDLHLLGGYKWLAAIVDESHNIKNPSAQITKAVYQLTTSHRVALSGTPVMNNTFDLYAQLQFLLPGLLGSQEFFKREYATPIDRYGDETKTAALRNLVSPFILRRTKRQVAADLPEKTESILWCEMGAAQRAFYEEIKASIRDSIFLDIKNQGLERSKLNILQGLQRLRQICDSPQLLKDSGGLAACQESAKIDILIERILRLRQEGNKALIFSQFTAMLDLAAARCKQENIIYYHFDGSTAIEQRHEMVRSFQEEQDPATVFLISLKAGNAGLTLTAAQYVYLIDPWWNQAVEQQAIDRTHRIGQKNSVFAYRMICKDTVEEKIVALQQKKKRLSDELVSEEEGLVKYLSEEELQYLFS